MVENAPILSMHHAGLTVEGYSRAAVQSYWRIPELKIGFDLGAQPWDFMGTPTWLVTHTHLDHAACLPVYIARRRMMRMEPPTLYLPEEALYMIRYHSFYAAHREGAYDHLMNDQDRRMFGWVQRFNPYDLYSKADQRPDLAQLRPFYEALIAEYFPPTVRW